MKIYSQSKTGGKGYEEENNRTYSNSLRSRADIGIADRYRTGGGGFSYEDVQIGSFFYQWSWIMVYSSDN